jgi:hypothetical protein
MGRPRRKPWTILLTPVCFLSYRRLSPQFQFSLSAATLVYLSRWGCPRRTPWTVLRTVLVSYRRLLPLFQFSLSAVTLVYLSQWDGHSLCHDPMPLSPPPPPPHATQNIGMRGSYPVSCQTNLYGFHEQFYTPQFIHPVR